MTCFYRLTIIMGCHWRSTQVGRRGVPAKDVGRVTGAGVRISPSPELGTNTNPIKWFFVGEAFAVVFPLEQLGG